jgi:phosphomannomutase
VITPELRVRVIDWIAADPHDGDRAELLELLDRDDVGALAARFSGPLTFGTAGLRGPLRAGERGMNLAVVRRTTAGVARWVLDQGGTSVVVGYDARHRSREFAHDAAATLAGAGLAVHLADRPWPTPLTAYAVQWCDADAGVQVTASHNPAADNGYKVYDRTGAQIIPPDDARILAAITAQPAANAIAQRDVTPNLGADVIDAYAAMAMCVVGRTTPRTVRIVYTPLHGVGGAFMSGLFAAAGFHDVHLVESQFEPDPTFGGLAFPNPEEPGVLDAALDVARTVGAGIVIANDPDADRLALCVESPVHGWRPLTGDEIGLLLGDELMARRAGPVARSSVSSQGLDAAATARGQTCVVTSTGFKWLSRAADRLDAPLVFAYEEALGYAVSTAVRDKDGLTAALIAAECASIRAPLAALATIAHRDGQFVTSQWSVRFEDPDACSRILGAESGLDAGLITIESPEGRVLLRASGTEPKLKCYFEVWRRLATATAEEYERVRDDGLAACARMQVALASRLGI